jgi:hypothetical protein
MVIIANYIFKKFSSLTCPCRAPKRVVCVEIPDRDKRGWELRYQVRKVIFNDRLTRRNVYTANGE